MVEEDERYIVIPLSVCVDCIQLLSNGEINDGEDTAEKVGAALETRWPVGETHPTVNATLEPLVPGVKEFGYCTTSCEGCGSHWHGDRFEAFAFYRKN